MPQDLRRDGDGRLYGLRTVSAALTSNGGFRWPEAGRVACSDWNPEPRCGGGLHYLAWGLGCGQLLSWDEDARWLVVAVPAGVEAVDIDGEKSKSPELEVVYCGDRPGACAEIIRRGATCLVVGAVITAGDHGVATVGEGGAATAGFRGIATTWDRGTAVAGRSGVAAAGDDGTAIAGSYGTATARHRGVAIAGQRGTAIAGNNGTATVKESGTGVAGEYGTATAGGRGTAIAGYGGVATAGYCGTAVAGQSGTAIAGYGGTAIADEAGAAAAGELGVIILKRWDGKAARWRLVVAYVGEGGIQPYLSYRLGPDGRPEPVPADPPAPGGE